MKTQIIHLARRYHPDVGGVETHVRQVLAHLSPGDWDSWVIAQLPQQASSGQSSPRDPSTMQLPIADLPDGAGLVQKTRYKLLLWAHLARVLWQLLCTRGAPLAGKPVIFQVHDVFFWLLPFLPLIWLRSLFVSTTIYMTFHGYEHARISFRERFWHQLAWRLSSGSIAIGAFHERWYGVVAQQILFGAVDGGAKRGDRRQHDERSGGQRRDQQQQLSLVFLGRLHSDLGIMHCLRALQALGSLDAFSQYTVHLDVFGDGPEKKQAQAFVRAHGLPVTFHGFCPDAREHLGSYDVAFVSGYLSIIEALAARVPVIAFVAHPLKYDYLHTAPFYEWIATAHTSSQSARALAQICAVQIKHNDDFETHLHAAQTWAQAQTWQRVAAAYEQLWGGLKE